MPFVIDDIAVAAVTAEAATAATAIEATTATEVATAAESTVAAEATTALDVISKGTTLTEIPATESTIDLSDAAFFDEFPSLESSEIQPEIGGLDGENVFYDEFPSDTPSESKSATETVTEGSQEINSPKPYEELCETRDCGGSYKDLKNEGWGWNDNPPHEVHHMPSDSASHLEREEGPAIAIDYGDHQQTASCGSSREAIEYRAAQKELIDKGDFRGALQMDIDDLHDKFGDKYDEAISQMLDYVDELEKAGKI